MFVAHIPETTRIWVGWDAFKHQCGCTIRQWTVNDVRVTCYPAHIRSTPVNFTVLVVKYGFVRHCRLQQVAACAVQCTFGFACRARSVEDEQWFISTHCFRSAFCIRCCYRVVIPNVTTFRPFHRVAATFNHDTGVNGWALLNRFVCIGFQWDFFAAAHGLVRRNDHAAFRIADTVAQCIW